MDATAYLALSAALDRELPSALESMAEARERAAMAFEDLAARAITGRVVANPEQLPASSRPAWSLWRRAETLYRVATFNVALWGHRAAAAMHGNRIAEAAVALAHIMDRIDAPDVNYDYYENGRLVGPPPHGFASDSEDSDADSDASM